jgi:hypothetical protein
MMKIPAAMFALLLGASGVSAAQDQSPSCEGRSEIVASCFSVRGRLSYWNGTPSARIWRVGTHRVLGIHHDELPKEIEARMSGFDTELWGDFRVCPFTHQQPGHMQFVCVESWRNIKVRQRQ